MNVRVTTQEDKTTFSLARIETQEEVEEALKTFEAIETKCNVKFLKKKKKILLLQSIVVKLVDVDSSTALSIIVAIRCHCCPS